MDVFTLYVGQGALAATRCGGEAVIIDAHMPDAEDVTRAQIEETLNDYLRSSRVRGLILTGFDQDHAHPAGVESILTTYTPDWIMYPKYYKDTDSASDLFRIIEGHEERRKRTHRPLTRHSVRLDRVDSRHLAGLANQFNFELFSPHIKDMDNSNNSGLVLKLTGLDSTGFSYLVTGDTETERWDTINGLFGSYLASDVMAAPHHGALTGVNARTVMLVHPNTVLISAGVKNQFGHPHPTALMVYQQVARHVYATNRSDDGEGVCLFTRRVVGDFETRLVRHTSAASSTV